MNIQLAVKMAKANLLALVRDRKALVFLFAMPLVITAVLSFALGGIFGSNPKIPSFPVVVYNQDAGSLGKGLVQTLEKQTGQMTVHEANSLASARAQTSSNEANVVVWIPQNFSQNIEAGHKSDVRIEAGADHDTESSIVNDIVQAYGQSMAETQFAAKNLPNQTADIKAAKVQSISTTLHSVSTGSYYAIGMMVMFMLTHALNRAGRMVREKQGDLYRRMMASPASRYAIVSGHLLSTFVVLLLYGAALLLCFRFILNIHLGPIDQTVMILVAYAVALSGISVALGSWINNMRIMDSLGQIGAQIAAILGGSFYPLYGFPQFMQRIGRGLPNGQVLTAMVNSVMGISSRELLAPFCYLVVLGIICGLVGSLRYGRTVERGGVAG
jgi:ABC-type Na+ efflux pump permease subunit